MNRSSNNTVKEFKKSTFLLSIIFLIISSGTIFAYAISVSLDATQNLGDGDGLNPLPQTSSSGDNIAAIWRDDATILFSSATNTNSIFNPSQPIGSTGSSNDAGKPQIKSSGTNVFTIWSDNTGADADIKFRKTTDVGVSFAAEVLLSSNTNTLSSLSPQLSVSSTNNVFAAWHDKVDSSNGFVMFRSGGASGNSFAGNSIVQVGTTDRQDPKPQMTTLGNNIYIAWQTNSNIKLATSTNGGTSFTSTINVGSTGSASDSSPQIAAGTNTIYVIWKDGINIELARITSNGQTITGTDTIGFTSDFTCDLDVENSAQVAASGNDVYAVWCDDDVGGGDIIFYSSSDEGANFTVKNISQNTGLSTKAQLTVSGDNVFVVWSDGTPTGEGS